MGRPYDHGRSQRRFVAHPDSPLFDSTRGINEGTPVGDEVLSDLAQSMEQDNYDPTA